MPSIVVVGLQWGDEGKGKVIDLLSESARHIARAQGGNNAGHSVLVKGQEYQFHLIPSGILYPHTRCYIGGGTVIDPKSLLQEMEMMKKRGIAFEKRLFLSQYAHVVFPYHRQMDELLDLKKKESVGTTKKGIGPCYADKAQRLGFRLADLLSPSFADQLKKVLEWKNAELERMYGKKPISYEELLEEYLGYADALRPFVFPVEQMLYEAMQKGEVILYEGAQGALLDTTFGTYPFVTSSCTTAGGIPSGLGIGPSRVGSVVGVLKAYVTRVGSGPFPTELSEEERVLFPDPSASREVGVTTGRVRRLGWFDVVLAKHTLRLNGVDSIALMKLDILDEIDTIKICVGYRLDGQIVETFPTTADEHARLEPIYEMMPGWKCSTGQIEHFEDLPEKAQAYVKRLEVLCEVGIGFVSTGPARNQTLWLSRFFQEVST